MINSVNSFNRQISHQGWLSKAKEAGKKVGKRAGAEIRETAKRVTRPIPEDIKKADKEWKQYGEDLLHRRIKPKHVAEW